MNMGPFTTRDKQVQEAYDNVSPVAPQTRHDTDSEHCIKPLEFGFTSTP